MSRPGSVPVITDLSDPSHPSGGRYVLAMLALGAWVAFYPVPHLLAIAIAVILPPLAFVAHRPDKVKRLHPHLLPATRPQLLAASSAFLVFGLGFRWWNEYALLEFWPWAVASFVSSVVLLLLAQLYRPSGDMTVWRALVFCLYVGSVSGLLNKHADTAAPAYVQGIVTDARYINGDGRSASRMGKTAPRSYTVGPYLQSERHTIELALFERSTVKEGDPMCSARHAGRFGFAWSTFKPGLCPVPDAAQRVRTLQKLAPR